MSNPPFPQLLACCASAVYFDFVVFKHNILDACEYDWTIDMDGPEEPLRFAGPNTFFRGFWPLVLWAAASKSEVLENSQLF